MKKLLILLLILSACKKEVYYYPSEDFFKDKNPQEIVIDNLSFKEITDSVSNELFKRNRLFITLENSKYIYKISPFTYTGGFIKEKNILEINNDSLKFNHKNYSLNQLKKYLKIHYENNGEKPYLSDSYKRAFVKLTIDENKSSDYIQENIFFIVDSFNKANIVNKDSIEFGLMLDFILDKILTIPPPPSPIEIVD